MNSACFASSTDRMHCERALFRKFVRCLRENTRRSRIAEKSDREVQNNSSIKGAAQPFRNWLGTSHNHSLPSPHLQGLAMRELLHGQACHGHSTARGYSESSLTLHLSLPHVTSLRILSKWAKHSEDMHLKKRTSHSATHATTHVGSQHLSHLTTSPA